MKRLATALSACLVALLWQGCATPSQSTAIASREPPKTKAEPQKLKEITPAFRRQLLEYMQFRRYLFTDPIECIIEEGDICPILVQLVQVSDSNGTYCIGLLPEKVTLRNTALTNPEKRIVWKLVPPVPPVPNSTFYFHSERDHGVIWLSTTMNPPQVHTGRLGDGSPGTPDPSKWHVRNRHRATGEAVYVPIILQRDNLTGKIALCGTPDPIIYNDN